MHKTKWYSGNLVFASANHIKVIKSKDGNIDGELVYDNYFKRDDLVEVLHILKEDHDFHKTNLIVSDGFCQFYQIELERKTIKKDIGFEVEEVIKSDIGKSPEDWGYEIIHEDKKKVYVLGYLLRGNDFGNVKNALKLSNIEVQSIRPRVFFDYYQKSSQPKNPVKLEVEETRQKTENTQKDNELNTQSDLDTLETVSFPMVKDKVDDPKKSRSFLHLNLEKSHLFSPWMLIIFVFIIAVTGVSVFGVYKLREKMKSVSQKNVTQPTQVQTLSPTPTPASVNWDDSKIDLSSYDILLLGDGSQDSNLKDMENLLLSEGVLSIETGESEVDKPLVTLITHKTNIPKPVVSRFTEVLNTEYSTDLGGDLADDYAYDFVIVVGNPKPLE